MLCFVGVILSFWVDVSDVFTHIRHGSFTGIGPDNIILKVNPSLSNYKHKHTTNTKKFEPRS